MRAPLVLVLLGLLTSPLLGDGMSLEIPRNESVRVIVRYREAPVTRDLDRIGARVERRFTRLIHGVSATVRRRDLAAIRALPNVASVHEDRRVYATLAQSVPATRADRVWQSYATRGQGKVVAVIDTGVDWQHAAFGSGFGPGHRVAGGWDFVNDDADPDDDNGHGTHVAGIVGADGGGLTGVAPGVSFLAYKVLGEDGSGDSSDVIAALERAVENHADVINISLGAPAGSEDPMDDPLIQAVENAVASGCVVVISAGNTGLFYSVGTPGIAPAAITVGAITRENAVASFSSRGPASSQLLAKPEIVAPGVGIVSAKAGGGTVALNGTSMAAPHVAGIAALLRAIHPQWTPAEVKSALVSTAVPLGHEIVEEGAGRVDAVPAAETTLFAAPTIASLGVTSGLPLLWTSAVNVSLTNRSAVSRTVTVTGVTGQRDGIQIMATNTVTIPPGQTRDVAVRVEVDNSRLPAPARGSLSFGGTITLKAGSETIRVPWMFVKAATVSLDWQGDDQYGGIITGKEYVTSFGGNGRGVAKLFVPAIDFDLAVASMDEDGEIALLFFADREAAGNPTLAASRALAKNVVTTATVDHRGVANAPANCSQTVALKLDGRALGHIRLRYDTRRLHINDVASTPVLLFDACGDAEGRAMYTVDRAAPVPLAGDFTMANSPDEYLAVPLRVALPPSLETPYVAMTPGLVIRTPGGGSLGEAKQVRSPGSGPFWHGTLYMTPPADPSLSGGALVGPAALQGAPLVESPLLRREGNRVVTALGMTPSPNAFTVEGGETIDLGAGPLYPVSQTASSTANQFFTSFHEWKGLLGEIYRPDLVHGFYELYDEQGTLLRATSYMCCDGVPPGAYRVVGTATLQTAAGLDRSTVITTFDTRRTDVMPPSLHTVRIVDAEGRVSRRLQDGGSLVFSVKDLTIDDVTLISRFKPFPQDRVAVTWRRAGTLAWVPATAVVTANDEGTYETLNHPPTGVHYRVDLGEAIRVRAPIDLRISFADDAGNTTEWIGERVFSGGEPRRRPVRH